MNDTVRLHPEVAEFAAAVRAQLSDLSSDEIEELTGDLDADLQERVEDAGEVDLGDPAAYASELRTAAGLPPRDDRDDRAWYEVLRAGIEERGARLETRLRSSRGSSAALDFGIAVRPVWWLLRAWIAYQIAHVFFRTNSFGTLVPESPQGWAALLAAMVVSVQWGRRRWLPSWPWVSTGIIVGNIVAVLAAPLALDHARDQLSYVGDMRAVMAPAHTHRGLELNGQPIRNVFAYDAQGEVVRNVQLYNQNGKPLTLRTRHSWRSVAVPARSEDGQKLWNVFPIARVPRRDTVRDPAGEGRVPAPDAVVEDPDAPMVAVPPIESDELPKTDQAKKPGEQTKKPEQSD